MNTTLNSAWATFHIRIRMHLSQMCAKKNIKQINTILCYSRLRMIIWLQNTWTEWCIHAQYKTLPKYYSWDVIGTVAVEIPAPMAAHASASSEPGPLLQSLWSVPSLFCRERSVSVVSTIILCNKCTEENLPWSKKDPLKLNKVN